MHVNHDSHLLSKTTTASQWIQHNGAQYHEAFNTAVESITPQPTPQIEFTEQTWRSITQFQAYVTNVRQRKRLKDYEFLTKYNAAGGSATWSDVQKEARSAMEAYEARGARNWFIRVGRGTGEKVPALQSWLGLISGNEFATIACGVLSLFFGAATALSKVRSAVKSTMESLTSTVDDTEEMLQLYCNDQVLRSLAEQLFVAILNGTKEMIHWLDSHGTKEALKAILKQGSYANELNESMNLIKEKTNSFLNKANILLHARVFKVEKNTLMIHEDVACIDGKVTESNTRLERISEAVSRLEETLAASQWFADSAQTNKILAHLFCPPERLLPATSADEILDILQVHPMMSAEDLAQANGYYDNYTETQSRGIRVLDDWGFRNWCTSNASEMLLIDDLAADDQWKDSSTALTTVSAKFIEALISLRIVVPLIFFCGAHTTRDDPFAGTHGMMRSMNHQLLQQFKGASLPFVDQQLLYGLHSYDINYQYELFRRLLGSMQSTTVFCVIDSISDLDNGRYGHELGPLICFLRQLIMDFNGATTGQRTGPILKVLFTAPAMGATLAGFFREENKVSIPDADHDMIPGMGDSFIQNSVVEMYSLPY